MLFRSFIMADSLPPNGLPAVKAQSDQAQIISQDSAEFKIIQFDVNFIKLRTNFSSAKFLVYNDSYHTSWKVFVNGKENPEIYSAVK